MRLVWICSVLVCLLTISYRAQALEEEYTITVPAGKHECFFHTVKAGQTLEVDYQVIDGGQHGELDINFHLYSPRGHLIVSDFKKEDNNHRVDSTEEGDYKLCWENSYSHFNTKLVFFEIMVDIDKEHEQTAVDQRVEENESGQYFVSIADSIEKVHSRLAEARRLQDMKRAHEARDRNIAEGNYTRVNNWSLLHIILMLAVGGVQVVMVRSLFDDRSRVHQFWKKNFSSR